MGFRPLTQEELQVEPFQTFGPEPTQQDQARDFEASLTPQDRETMALNEAIGQQRLATEQQEAPIGSAILPRFTEAQAMGRGGVEQTLSTGADLLSLLGRTIASAPELFSDQEKSFVTDLAKTKGTGFIEDIIRSPELGAAALTAPVSIPLAAGRGLLGLSAVSAGEGLLGGAVTQAEKVGGGQPFDPAELITDVALSAVTPSFLKGAGQVIKKTFNPVLGRLTAELTNVSEEALRKSKGNFGKGAKELQAAAGTAEVIGEKILKMLDDVEVNQAFKGEIDQILQQTPNIKTKGIIDALKDAIPPGKIPFERQATKEIKAIITGIKADGKELTALAYRDLRKRLDFNISFDKEEANIVNTALKKARKVAQQTLIEATPKQYASTMKKWSSSIKAKDALKRVLGKTSDTREAKIEGFVSNLFGKNKSHRQKIIRRIDDAFGENFSEKIKLNKLADELGPQGIPSIMSRTFTGRSALGGIAGHSLGGPTGAVIGLGLSSPKIASGTLGLTDFVQNQFLKGAGSSPVGFGARKLISAPQTLTDLFQQEGQ